LAACAAEKTPQEAQQFIDGFYNEMEKKMQEMNEAEWNLRVVPNDQAEPVETRYVSWFLISRLFV
jgi:hypothetical protein